MKIIHWISHEIKSMDLFYNATNNNPAFSSPGPTQQQARFVAPASQATWRKQPLDLTENVLPG